MKNLEVIIGLEVHIQINTRSKMFCSCPNESDKAEPNLNICPTCLGVVGSLPLINKKAIEKIILLGLSLDCEIAKKTKWDRKNYFYPDLPKGYQISQFDQPICSKGVVSTFDEKGDEIKVRVNRIHLEEDAAKTIHTSNQSLIDFNRSSAPLMELVTEPDLKSAKEAGNLLREIRRVVRYLNVSGGDMEKGHIRCDASISMRPEGDEKLYPRTEIKNLNSFKMVEKALLYEIERQTECWNNNNPDSHERTVLWNDTESKTEFMRDKEGSADYRYFPEPDIPEVELEDSFVESIKGQLIELPHQKMKRYLAFGLDRTAVESLVEDKNLSEYFDQLLGHTEEGSDLHKSCVKWFLGESLPAYKKAENQMKISTADTFYLVEHIEKREISKGIAKQIFEKIFFKNADLESEIRAAKEASQNIDLDSIVKSVMESNPQIIEQYLAGKEKVINALVGQAIGRTKGLLPANEVRDAVLKAAQNLK